MQRLLHLKHFIPWDPHVLCTLDSRILSVCTKVDLLFVMLTLLLSRLVVNDLNYLNMVVSIKFAKILAKVFHYTAVRYSIFEDL